MAARKAHPVGRELTPESEDASVANTLALAQTMQALIDAARAQIGAHQGVLRVALDEHWLQVLYAVSLSDKLAGFRSLPVEEFGIDALACPVFHPIRMTQADLVAHPLWRDFIRARSRGPALRGWLAIPLLTRSGRNFGLIELADKYVEDFSAEDEAALARLAVRIADKLEIAWLSPASEDSLTDQARLTTVVTPDGSIPAGAASESTTPHGLGHAVITTNLDGRITDWNPDAETLLGYAPREVLGQPIAMLLAQNATRELRYLQRCIERCTVIHRPGSILRAKGDAHREVHLVLSPLRDRAGAVCGAVLVARDAADDRRRELALH